MYFIQSSKIKLTSPARQRKLAETRRAREQNLSHVSPNVTILFKQRRILIALLAQTRKSLRASSLNASGIATTAAEQLRNAGNKRGKRTTPRFCKGCRGHVSFSGTL